MKAPKTALERPEERFKKALASVLSASPEQIRESRALAKAEKPSPHTRYTYAPEEGQP
jgi:lambda repressor-like predicted transcriptional regulator